MTSCRLMTDQPGLGARCSINRARSWELTRRYIRHPGSVGIGFAIPSNVVKNVVAQLRDHGAVARGWLGVQMQPMTATLAKAVGLPNNRRRSGRSLLRMAHLRRGPLFSKVMS